MSDHCRKIDWVAVDSIRCQRTAQHFKNTILTLKDPLFLCQATHANRSVSTIFYEALLHEVLQLTNHRTIETYYLLRFTHRERVALG